MYYVVDHFVLFQFLELDGAVCVSVVGLFDFCAVISDEDVTSKFKFTYIEYPQTPRAAGAALTVQCTRAACQPARAHLLQATRTAVSTPHLPATKHRQDARIGARED